MSDETWTPDTETVRDFYQFGRYENHALESLGQREAEFDRWLEAHDREHEAWSIEKYATLVEETSKANAHAMDEDDWDETKRLLGALRDYAKLIREGKM